MAKGIEKGKISYQLEYTNRRGRVKTRTMNVRTFGNRDLVAQERAIGDAELPVMVLPGYAQGRRVLKKAVERLAKEQGIYAVGVHLPLLRLPRRESAIERALTEIPVKVAESVRGGSPDKVFVIGQSMGAGVFALAAAAASRSPETNPFGEGLLLQPPVMEKVDEAIVETPTHKRDEKALQRARKSYVKRFLKNDPPLRVRGDKRATYDNVKTLVDAAARNVYDAVMGRFKVQFNFAVTRSTSEAIKKYTDNTNNQIVIPLGAQDPVSTLTDANIGLIAAGAQPDNPAVIVVDNVVHTTPHLPQGLELIEKGLAVFEAKGRPVKRHERRPNTRPERRRWRLRAA